MNTWRRVFLGSALLSVLLPPVVAQSAPIDSLVTGRTPWEFSLAGSYYAFPADADLPMVVARANHGALHLEARYNYEARQTASVYAGWNFSSGETFTIGLTPMAGATFGSTTGIVPALEVELGYGILDFYAEGEYLFDIHDSSENFAYSWLELGATPSELFRVGLVAQRTRIFRSSLGLDRGPFAQLTAGPATLSLYAFNLFTESWFLVLGLQIAW